MSKLVSVGKILNFHGIKGEVKVGFTAGNEDLIKNLRQIYIFQDTKKIPFDIQSVRFHKNFAIVKFKQINSIDDVMTIKGLLIHVNEDTLKSKLGTDEFLITDLIGITAYDENDNEIGRIVDVGENKATNLLEVEKNNGIRFMVPFVKELVPAVDIKNKKIIINMIEGIDTNGVE